MITHLSTLTMQTQIAALLLDESEEVNQHALLVLGNLCSDAVDSDSALSKDLLVR